MKVAKTTLKRLRLKVRKFQGKTFSNKYVKTWKVEPPPILSRVRSKCGACCAQIMKRSLVKTNDILINDVNVIGVIDLFSQKKLIFSCRSFKLFFVALRQFQANFNGLIYELENDNILKWPQWFLAPQIFRF